MSSIYRVVTKIALFLLISCVLMLFMVAPMTAEWYITLFSVVINCICLACAIILQRRSIKKENDSSGSDSENKK